MARTRLSRRLKSEHRARENSYLGHLAQIAPCFLPGLVRPVRRCCRSNHYGFTRTADMLASNYGFPHQAMEDLKARSIRLCEYRGDYHHLPLGTHLTGDTPDHWEEAEDIPSDFSGCPAAIGAAPTAKWHSADIWWQGGLHPDHAALDDIAYAMWKWRSKFTGPTKRSNRSNSL